MRIEDITSEDMKTEEWNIIDDLSTEEDIIDYLAAAFEEPADGEYIRHAIATAVKAINTHSINMEAAAPPPPPTAPAVECRHRRYIETASAGMAYPS